MKWQIYLYGIVWDDGKGEYDVSDLPPNLRVEVPEHIAADRNSAIEEALTIASDEYEFLIAGTEQIQVTRAED